jgi:hypothetical protein
MRHLQVIGMNAFSDEAMMKIFTSITDWHFTKGSGKDLVKATSRRP